MNSLPEPAVRSAARLRELWHFAASQASATVASALDVLVMEGLILLGMPYGWAILAGHLAGGVSDFAAKRHLIFRTPGQRQLPQALRYLLAWAGSLLLNLGLAQLLVAHLRMGAGPAALAAALLVGLCWNYPAHRLYVFRSPRRVG